MANSGESAYKKEMERVSIMTLAGQQKPEQRDGEYERFAACPHSAKAERPIGHIVAN